MYGYMTFKSVVLAIAGAGAVMAAPAPAQTVAVTARIETDPVKTLDDAADDPAIWRNVRNPMKSLIIGTDKKAGIHVYSLTGKKRSFTPSPRLNNVDLRSGVRLGEKSIVLVAASDRSDIANAKMALFRLDTLSAKLKPLGSIGVGPGEAYGMCLWKRAKDNALYGFVVMKDGRIDQVALDTTGPILTGRVARSMKLATQSEGCVVDDRTGQLYVAEEDVGLWRFDADPAGSTVPVSLAKVDNKILFADVEGLALAPDGASGGYLIVSSQGDNAYAVFNLPDARFVGRFRIDAGKLDRVTETDGIELVLGTFGKNFPAGLFVAQDGDNAPHAQNFKFTAWQDVMDAIGRQNLTVP
jgi:3-phytase